MSQPDTEGDIDCPFCIPPAAQVIHETDLVFALYDGFPVSPGHALILPRRHIASWKEATPEEKTAIWNEIDGARAVIESAIDRTALMLGSMTEAQPVKR